MMRYVIALLLVVHGLAHLVGFVVPWQWVSSPELPYKTTILAGRIDVGGAGIRVVGLMWLVMALAFLAAGSSWLLGAPWALPFTSFIAVASALLCAVELPQARIGLVVSIGLAAAAPFIRAVV